MGLADLHLHTQYSHDGTASVPAVLARAERTGNENHIFKKDI
jgi:predicted metal-dependent phosphoesterase TrpH